MWSVTLTLATNLRSTFCLINPLRTGNPSTGIWTNSEDPDETWHNGAFHKDLQKHCLLRQKLSSEKEIQFYLEITYNGLSQVYCIKPERITN